MIDYFAQHPILVLTHILAAVAGYFLHYWLVCRWKHEDGHKIVFDWRQIVAVIVHVLVFGLFIGSVYNSQYQGGPTPGLVFTLMAAYSFGSLAAERGFFADLIRVITRSNK